MSCPYPGLMANTDISATIDRAVQMQRQNGFGDLTAALDAGEYVYERRHCPHKGCTWSLDAMWRRGIDVTRWRGTADIERQCQAHLESHLPSMVFMEPTQ